MNLLLHELTSKSWLSTKKLTAAVQDTALKQGKRAVVQTKGGTFRKYGWKGSHCSWFVNASHTRHMQKEASWHVTKCNLEHINCTGVPKSTQHRIAASSVMRSAVAADNAASVGALSEQLQLQEGFQCNSSLVGRAKEQIVLEIFAEDCESIQLLPSFLQHGRFEKAILVLDSQLFQNGQQVFGVDVAHMKHRNYNGVQLVFVARDGNMENKISVVALVPLENAENYKWFFGTLLAREFPILSIPVLSDRHVGIVADASALNIRVHFCTRHIIGNLRADKTIRLQISHEAFVWGAQAARTRAQYDFNLYQLEVVNSGAALYLKALEPSQWALYPHYTTTPYYGWRTTNFVESEQAHSLRLKPRKLFPYEFFRAYSNILMGECYKRIAQSQKWEESDRILTPRAHAKLQQELKEIPKYIVTTWHSAAEGPSKMSAGLA